MKNSPKLDKPGAGIPWLHRAAFKYLILPKLRVPEAWDKCSRKFLREGEKILALTASLPTEKMEEKVLVPPMKGLEDSSRFWSVAMTLEHLMIVGKAGQAMIPMLSRGQTPPVEVDIAKVKPPGAMGAVEARKAYEDFFRNYPSAVEKNIGNKDSPSQHRHPWFGLMNLREWYGLFASHQEIHRKQIEAILKELNV